MISIQAHFDGKVIVPDGPVDLPRNQALRVQIETVGEPRSSAAESCLAWLGENAIDGPSIPADLAHQHHHYLYGSPKRDS